MEILKLAGKCRFMINACKEVCKNNLGKASQMSDKQNDIIKKKVIKTIIVLMKMWPI